MQIFKHGYNKLRILLLLYNIEMTSYNKPTESLTVFNSSVFSDTVETSQIPETPELNVTVDNATALNLAIPFLQTGGSTVEGDYQASIDSHLTFDPSRNSLIVGNISGSGKLTINNNSNIPALVVPNGYLDFNHTINGTTIVSQNSIINRVTSNAWNGSFVTGKIVQMIGAVTRLLIDRNFIINLSYDGISNGFLGVRDSTFSTFSDLFSVSSYDITSRLTHIFHSGILLNSASSSAVINIPNGFINMTNQPADDSLVSQSCINMRIVNAANSTNGKYKLSIGGYNRLSIDTNAIIDLCYNGTNNGVMSIRDSTYASLGDLFSVSSSAITSRLSHTFQNGILLNSSGTSAVLTIPNGFINMSNQPADDSLVSQSCINMRIINAANSTNGRYKLSIGGYNKLTIDTDMINYIASSGSTNGNWTIKGWDSAINGNYIDIQGGSSITTASFNSHIACNLNKLVTSHLFNCDVSFNTIGPCVATFSNSGTFNNYSNTLHDCNTTFSNASSSTKCVHFNAPIKYNMISMQHQNETVYLTNTFRNVFILGQGNIDPVNTITASTCYLPTDPFEGQEVTFTKTQSTTDRYFYIASTTHAIQFLRGIDATMPAQFAMVSVMVVTFQFSYASNKNSSTAGTWFGVSQMST